MVEETRHSHALLLTARELISPVLDGAPALSIDNVRQVDQCHQLVELLVLALVGNVLWIRDLITQRSRY